MTKSHQDDVSELASAMEVVRIPSNHTNGDGKSSSLALSERIETFDMTDEDAAMRQPAEPRQPPPLVQPHLQTRRPYDELGPAADPIPFAPPRFSRGRRDNVLCYNQSTDTHEVVKNVLMRDFSRNVPSPGGTSTVDTQVREAYWPIPDKPQIRTIMGHVEICVVLQRCVRQHDEDTEDDASSSEEGADDDDDDIVFEWTERKVAVKVNYADRMEKLRNRHAEDPLKEIAAMQLLGEQHQNVLGCKDVLFDGTNLNVVMRFCDSGDLFQLLQDCQKDPLADTPGMNETQARYWFRQIVAGVKQMHSIGVCHRDLSPENIMIDGKGALVIDMGMCLRAPYSNTRDGGPVTDMNGGTIRCLFRPQGSCGKLPYMSPEVYRNRESFDGQAVDIWTAGTILFCMVTGNRSYQRPHSSDPQFYWMTKGLFQLLGDWGVRLSPECGHLLQNMLQVDPRLRLTLDEVVNHPWFFTPDEPMNFSRR